MAKKTVPKEKVVCVVCKGDKGGLPVAEDPVIRLIRAVKSRLGVVQGNTLVVCGPDVKKAVAKRARFERYLMLLAFLGVAMLIIILLTSKDQLSGVLMGLFSLAFVAALSLLVYYPGIDGEALAEWKKKEAGKKK